MVEYLALVFALLKEGFVGLAYLGLATMVDDARGGFNTVGFDDDEGACFCGRFARTTARLAVRRCSFDVIWGTSSSMIELEEGSSTDVTG